MFYTRILVLIIAPLAIFSQTWTYDTIVEGAVASEVQKDKWGYLYSLSDYHKKITKLDRKGALQWQISFAANQRLWQMSCAEDSTFYLCGSFTDSLTVGGGTYSAFPGGDPWIARYDASGNLLWFKTAPGKGPDNIRALTAKGSDLIITGTVADTVDFFGQTVVAENQQLVIAKLNNSGVPQLVKVASYLPDTVYNGSSSGYDCGIDAGGGIYVLAYSAGQTYLDTFSLGVGFDGYYNIGTYLVVKLDAQLQTQWVCKLSSCYMFCHHFYELAVAPSGRSYVRSHYSYGQSGADDDYSTIHQVSSSGNYVNLYGIHGNSYGYSKRRNHMYALDVDSCGNVYFCGSQRTSYYAQTTQKSFLTVGQLSPDLNLNWIREDSVENGFHTATSVNALSVNDCVVTGIFWNGDVMADTLIDTSATNGNDNFFLARLQTTVGAPFNLTPYTSQTFCSGNSATLQAIAAAPVSWYSDQNSSTSLFTGIAFATPTLDTGVHTYYAQASTCSMTTARIPISVTVNPSPDLQLSDGIICHVGSYTISPSGCISYKYTGGSAIVSPSSTTSYTVTGTNVWGCMDNGVCTVSVLALPQPTIVSTINFICPGQTAILSCLGASTATWQTGIISQSIAVSPTVTTIYTLTAADEFGCTNTALFPQFVYDCTLGTNSLHVDTQFRLYPNPTNGIIYFESLSHTLLSIVNSCGQEVYSREVDTGVITQDLSHLPSGIYSARVGTACMRFVKQ